MILGLDISTSIVGASVLDMDNNLLLCEAWDLRNKKHFPTLYEKGKEINYKFESLLKEKKFNIEHIYIEESLQAFRMGFSSSKIIVKLSKFNGLVAWLCEDFFLKRPEYINSKTARKICGIKVPKGEKPKKIILEHFLKNEKNFDMQYTKHGNPQAGMYDCADSWVIAKAGYYLWKEIK
jgi:hypothetical protein